jgi:hypothetical protein
MDKPTDHDAEHPIDPDVRIQINATLARIEAEYAVKVLFACESGSRGWGFASPDSDYDVRFIYANRLDWYLTVLPGRDVIELPISDVYDVSGWDLRKALGLLRNGNATLVESLASPVIYKADPAFLPAIVTAAGQVSRPERAFHHYLHMARKNYREHLRGETVRLKKYLYVLRPLLACIWTACCGIPCLPDDCVAAACVQSLPVQAEFRQIFLEPVRIVWFFLGAARCGEQFAASIRHRFRTTAYLDYRFQLHDIEQIHLRYLISP